MSRAIENSSPLWRNRDYLILLSGQIVSVVGSRISQISLPLLLLGVTRSTAETGAVLALYGLPYPLFGMFAGVLVDRWDRKHVMIACEALNVVATGSIPVALWTNHLSVFQLALAALIAGAAFTFFNVAEVAAVPNVVSAEQLPASRPASHLLHEWIEPKSTLFSTPTINRWHLSARSDHRRALRHLAFEGSHLGTGGNQVIQGQDQAPLRALIVAREAPIRSQNGAVVVMTRLWRRTARGSGRNGWFAARETHRQEP